MKTIFIIDGTSGIWKSDLINYVSACKIKSGMFMKCSTRKKRPEEKHTDLKFLNNKAFEIYNFDFQYLYDKHKYGFNKKEIEDFFANIENMFIVIRNLDLIQEFAKTFSNYNIVKVFIYTDFCVVSKRIPNAENLQQKQCIADTFQDYLRHPDIYDEIIINGGTANDFNRLIDSLVARFTAPKQVAKQESKNKIDPNTLTIGEIIKNLKVSHLWGILAALVTLVVGAFALGQFFTTLKNIWQH